MNTITIPTTQHIELEYPVANLGTRILAGIIDLAIVFLSWKLALFLLEETVRTDNFWGMLTDPLFLLFLLPGMTYSLFMEIMFQGQTVGKMIMKTRTISLTGAAPTLSAYLIRWTLRLVDIWFIPVIFGVILPLIQYVEFLVFFLPGIVAVIFIGFQKKGQRLGDILAGTTVIKMQLVTTFLDTIYVETGESYQVVFPEIRTLSDRDISILKEVFDAGLKNYNARLLDRLASRIKEVTGIQSNMESSAFLQTVLSDYNHLYG